MPERGVQAGAVGAGAVTAGRAGTAARRIALAACVLLASCASLPSHVGGRAAGVRSVATGPVRLVVVLVVDQLRADRIGPGLPGGLGRLVREGRVFADAAHAHSDTETCPGHAVILSGRHPGPAGVPANEWVERASGRPRYCVEDATEAGRVLGAPAPAPGEATTGRSPRLLRVTALGDWIKKAHPGARVFSVSGKDRAAIALGGQRPDAAYWLDTKGALGFTTSGWYRAALPEWTHAWRGVEAPWLAGVPDRWEHASGAPANGARRDDHPSESPQEGRTSGHPVRAGEPRAFLGHLPWTPFLDDVTLDFARTLVREERLGKGAGPDLLALSLSATDYVGHLYGPGSQEARDALLRLDAALGSFLGALEGEVGAGGLLVALTADHGVLDLPEWLVEIGQSECPLDGGRGDAAAVRRGIRLELERRFGAVEASGRSWLVASGFSFTVNRPLAQERGVAPERIVEAAWGWLASQPGVAHVWTATEIETGTGPAAFATLYRNSYDPERSGDLVVQPVATCLFSDHAAGTSHGTPWLYDRAVPLVFFGRGVEPGLVRGRAAPVDVGPTLAAALGVATPAGLDGLPLALRNPP